MKKEHKNTCFLLHIKTGKTNPRFVAACRDTSGASVTGFVVVVAAVLGAAPASGMRGESATSGPAAVTLLTAP